MNASIDPFRGDSMRLQSKLATSLVALALVASTAVMAQGGPPPGAGRGPGMMGDGAGYGPGMMGGYGYGQGMMGGYGYGQGMMGGYGYGQGPGMMGGPGGPGYGRPGGLAALDLTDEQREKLSTLREQARRKN